MIPIAALTLLFAGEQIDPPSRPIRVKRFEDAQVTIRQRVIVRVPTRPPATAIDWKESKGPRCTSLNQIAGAVVVARDSVDLILRDGERMRAQFRSSCPALDFYSGFYMLPTEDRRICADRDSIHARSGGECEIQRFRRLQAVVATPPTAAPLPIQRAGSAREPR